jgi:hypothetical protein
MITLLFFFTPWLSWRFYLIYQKSPLYGKSAISTQSAMKLAVDPDFILYWLIIHLMRILGDFVIIFSWG